MPAYSPLAPAASISQPTDKKSLGTLGLLAPVTLRNFLVTFIQLIYRRLRAVPGNTHLTS